MKSFEFSRKGFEEAKSYNPVKASYMKLNNLVITTFYLCILIAGTAAEAQNAFYYQIINRGV
jgi:hypothetical protein